MGFYLDHDRACFEIKIIKLMQQSISLIVKCLCLNCLSLSQCLTYCLFIRLSLFVSCLSIFKHHWNFNIKTPHKLHVIKYSLNNRLNYFFLNGQFVLSSLSFEFGMWQSIKFFFIFLFFLFKIIHLEAFWKKVSKPRKNTVRIRNWSIRMPDFF